FYRVFSPAVLLGTSAFVSEPRISFTSSWKVPLSSEQPLKYRPTDDCGVSTNSAPEANSASTY
ncbi:hypothetical protein GCK32_011527, partial [Trichostrongylus colubriformis]